VLRSLMAAGAAVALAVVIGTIGLVFFSTHEGPAKTLSGPQLVLAGGSFDLGQVPSEQTVERTVAFQNSGVAPLRVSIVKVRPAPNAACGCGVESFGVTPGSVVPKGDGQLRFSLRVPAGMPDMQDVMAVDLQTNDPDRLQLQILITFTMAR
jgi:hypothetical protein